MDQRCETQHAGAVVEMMWSWHRPSRVRRPRPARRDRPHGWCPACAQWALRGPCYVLLRREGTTDRKPRACAARAPSRSCTRASMTALGLVFRTTKALDREAIGLADHHHLLVVEALAGNPPTPSCNRLGSKRVPKPGRFWNLGEPTSPEHIRRTSTLRRILDRPDGWVHLSCDPSSPLFHLANDQHRVDTTEEMRTSSTCRWRAVSRALFGTQSSPRIGRRPVDGRRHDAIAPSSWRSARSLPLRRAGHGIGLVEDTGMADSRSPKTSFRAAVSAMSLASVRAVGIDVVDSVLVKPPSSSAAAHCRRPGHMWADDVGMRRLCPYPQSSAKGTSARAAAASSLFERENGPASAFPERHAVRSLRGTAQVPGGAARSASQLFRCRNRSCRPRCHPPVLARPRGANHGGSRCRSPELPTRKRSIPRTRALVPRSAR